MGDINTRKKVLEMLAEARDSGTSVSGGTMANRLGVSRNTIWKAINSLKSEGYDIVSEQSKGYYLATHTDVLSEAGIREALADLPCEVKVFDTIDSTNTYAKTLDLSGPPVAIVADEQTAGRGRYGRSFCSPKGTGIYVSYSFKPLFPISEVTRVTTITACVVHKVLTQVLEENGLASTLGIKWINDIYRDNLKICGILTEGVGSIEANFERIIAGPGINVFPAVFPEELKDIAGSLLDEDECAGSTGALVDEGEYVGITGNSPDSSEVTGGVPGITRNEIVARLIRELHTAFYGKSTLQDSSYLDYYRKHCFILGRDVTLTQPGKPPRTAHAVDINENFELIAECDGERLVLSSGEVSARI